MRSDPGFPTTAAQEEDSTASGTLRLVLASGSPRRLELLGSAGLQPQVVPPEVDEAPRAREHPAGYVQRLAGTKARSVRSAAGEVLVAADTTVDLDGRILAKPADAAEAGAMLASLSGRWHLVHTGVAVRGGRRLCVRVVTTRVQMAAFGSEVVEWYVGTGEPLGKAGAYAIQGGGARLVERVEGSVTNVIGLPLAETLAMIGSLRAS